MQKYKLTYLNSTNLDKAGNVLKTKDGRPYSRVTIKTAEYGDKYLSGFENAVTKSWKVGDEVEIMVEEKGGANGVVYLNFSTPKKDDEVNQKLEQILNKLTGFGLQLEMIKEAIGIKKEFTQPNTMTSPGVNGEPPIDLNDIGF